MPLVWLRDHLNTHLFLEEHPQIDDRISSRYIYFNLLTYYPEKYGLIFITVRYNECEWGRVSCC